MKTLLTAIGAIVLFLVVAVAFSLLLALPTFYLWNWLMPVIFGVKTITVFQAWGVNLLSGILFKSHKS